MVSEVVPVSWGSLHVTLTPKRGVYISKKSPEASQVILVMTLQACTLSSELQPLPVLNARRTYLWAASCLEETTIAPLK